MTTTPPRCPSPSGTARYAGTSSPRSPVIVTVDVRIESLTTRTQHLPDVRQELRRLADVRRVLPRVAQPDQLRLRPLARDERHTDRQAVRVASRHGDAGVAGDGGRTR